LFLIMAILFKLPKIALIKKTLDCNSNHPCHE